MNGISGAAPLMDAETMKTLMGMAVAADAAQAQKIAVASATMKVLDTTNGLDVWA